MRRTATITAVLVALSFGAACSGGGLVARKDRSVLVVTSGRIPASTPANRALVVQRKLDDGSWIGTRKLIGSSDQLLTLPVGEYRVWDFDMQIATFTIAD